MQAQSYRRNQSTIEPSLLAEAQRSNPDSLETNSPASKKGVTFRVVVLCLALAAFFGYIIPVLDYKFANTYVGGTHLAPGALATLLILLLVVNPILRLLRSSLSSVRYSRNKQNGAHQL